MAFLAKRLAALGAPLLVFLELLGKNTALAGRILSLSFRGVVDRSARPDRRDFLWQLYFVSIQSLPVVLTTGAFAGMVLAYSFYFQFLQLDVENLTGPLVTKALVWQLGPVLAALMLGGRVGCAMTAELGSMVVTEQVDALRTMGADPVKVLVLPRVLAFTLMMPLMTIAADAVGIGAGMLLTVAQGAEWHFLLSQTRAFMVPYDYVYSVVKGVVFGLIIGTISCSRGLDTTGGAEGVGKATTEGNVWSSITVLIANFWLTLLLVFFDPKGW